ncbi:MAG: hypothetical protein SGI90_12650 [Candidatus Eisenbacteria bacterium]|nr:hypothetical protein [Candidatus Eisenbacteria bacterium]
MQAEIDTLLDAIDATERPASILGLTSVDDGSGNDTIVIRRMIPWLQDTTEWMAWESWEITYRDVVILDEENRIVDVYNLTSHDLANPANFATLKNMILEAAAP